MHPDPEHQSTTRGGSPPFACGGIFFAIATANSSVSGRGIRTLGDTDNANPSNHASPNTCWMGSPSANRSAWTANRSNADSLHRWRSVIRCPRDLPETCSSSHLTMPSRSSCSTGCSRARSHSLTFSSEFSAGHGGLPRLTSDITPAPCRLQPPAIPPSHGWWPRPHCAHRIGAAACSRRVHEDACPWGRERK